MQITIIGTGYVGLVTAVCLADAGFDVVCVDKDEKKIEMLNKGTVPFYEPGLGDLMKKNKDRLRFVETPRWGVSARRDVLQYVSTTRGNSVSTSGDVIFICVGTPPKEDGSPDMTAYWSVIDNIVETPPCGVSEKVLVINKSTVPVGTARKAQEKLGDAFIVVSMPEFLREGKAIHDFKHPDRVVVGCCRDAPLGRLTSNKQDAPTGRLYTDDITSLLTKEASSSFPLLSKEGVGGGILSDILKMFSCPILTMSWESAELTKYAANAFLATKISFINEIARLCEKVGADVDAVAEAIGKDPRIGEHFLKAGIGYGGSCFPKDVRALSALAGANDYEFELLKATIEVNQSQKEFVFKKIVETRRCRVLPETTETSQRDVSTIAVLGLAFKGDTDDIRESPALWLVQELIKKGFRVQCYDPQAMNNARRSPSPCKGEGWGEVVFSDSPESCLKDADCIVIATEWEEFKHLDWKALKNEVKTPVIVDAKNLFSQNEVVCLKEMGWGCKGVGR